MEGLVPVMRPLPGGSFLMGNDDGRPDERPTHPVVLAPFRAAVSPVTNAEYAAFVASAGASPPPFLSEPRFAAPEQPVVGVNWFEAVAFCEWLSGRTGDHYRLPTEAEREFAARGGLAGDWPWLGPLPACMSEVSGLDAPHPPRTGCANPFGLRCMADNVHEWCSDWYAPDYYAVSPAENPLGPAHGTRRASRGGSWRHREKLTRVNARSSLDPAFHYSDFGFRVFADA